MEQTTTLTKTMLDKWNEQHKREVESARWKSLKFLVRFLEDQGIKFSTAEDIHEYDMEYLPMYGYRFQDLVCVSYPNAVKPILYLLCLYCKESFLTDVNPDDYALAFEHLQKHWCWRKIFHIKQIKY